MPLLPDDVSRIAHLARLQLSPEDGASMLAQLNDFFRIVERMSAVDTSGVEPLFTPLSALDEVALRLRDDTVTEMTEPDARERHLANAPAREDGLFLVPQVLE